MAIETEAEKRYARAYEAAVQIIHETRDGLRNEKMNRAGYHIGRFGLWPCAMPQATVVYNLTTLAIAQGANRKEAERTIREGYEAGKKKDPVPIPDAKVRKVRTTNSNTLMTLTTSTFLTINIIIKLKIEVIIFNVVG